MLNLELVQQKYYFILVECNWNSVLESLKVKIEPPLIRKMSMQYPSTVSELLHNSTL